MRVEVHSPDGLESAYQGKLAKVEKDGEHWLLKTWDGFGVVLLYPGEMAQIVASVEVVAK